MAYKAFAFYQFSFGANMQIFLLVNSHLLSLLLPIAYKYISYLWAVLLSSWKRISETLICKFRSPCGGAIFLTGQCRSMFKWMRPPQSHHAVICVEWCDNRLQTIFRNRFHLICLFIWLLKSWSSTWIRRPDLLYVFADVGLCSAMQSFGFVYYHYILTRTMCKWWRTPVIQLTLTAGRS